MLDIAGQCLKKKERKSIHKVICFRTIRDWSGLICLPSQWKTELYINFTGSYYLLAVQKMHKLEKFTIAQSSREVQTYLLDVLTIFSQMAIPCFLRTLVQITYYRSQVRSYRKRYHFLLRHYLTKICLHSPPCDSCLLLNYHVSIQNKHKDVSMKYRIKKVKKKQAVQKYKPIVQLGSSECLQTPLFPAKQRLLAF